jgi:hypothetical protein
MVVWAQPYLTTSHAEQNVDVFVNGQQIARWTLRTANTMTELRAHCCGDFELRLEAVEAAAVSVDPLETRLSRL